MFLVKDFFIQGEIIVYKLLQMMLVKKNLNIIEDDFSYNNYCNIKVENYLLNGIKVILKFIFRVKWSSLSIELKLILI